MVRRRRLRQDLPPAQNAPMSARKSAPVSAGGINPRIIDARFAMRKSAPVSAGGVNVRRLALARAASFYSSDDEEDEDYEDERDEDGEEEEEEDDDDDEEEEEEKEPTNECGNHFCRQLLANRYARFCEDKPMCQRYRALKLQCQANAQKEEEEEDMRPLAHVIKRKKKKKEDKVKEPFAIPRRNTNNAASAAGKRSLDLNATEDKGKRKKLKRARSESTVASATASDSSSVQGSPVSSVEEIESFSERLKKRLHPRDPKSRQPAKTSSDAETGNAKAAGVSRVKKRRLNRRVSADDVLSRSSSSPVSAASTATNENWKIPRAKPGRVTTAAQAIRRNMMGVGPVALGVANQANLAGGGRYVQNGNRPVTQSLQSADPRSRPPSMTKFASPPVSSVPPAPVPPSASSRPLPTTRPTRPTRPIVPTPVQTQASPLPPLPPYTSSSAPKTTEATRAVTPVPSNMKTHAVVVIANPPATATNGMTVPPTSGFPGVTRISASTYLRNRKNGQERRPDRGPSRSSSLERPSSLTNHRASGPPPTLAPVYPAGPPEYHRSDSAPLPSYREARPGVDLRRPYPEPDGRHQRPYYDSERSRMEYRDRAEGRGEPMINDRPTSGPWEAHDFPPPRDQYPPRQQEPSSFGTNNNRGGGGYDYSMDTHFSPESPPAEQPYWRETSRQPQLQPQPPPPPPQRAPSPHRSAEPLNRDVGKSDRDDVDADVPAFSYHEAFLPGLLSVFIYKLPQSLEAVFNVTKKPRKMNWYIKYVERIERLCKPFDLQIKFDGLKAMVTVRGREWLTLQGTSTVTLHLEVIKSLRAEAMTWLQLYEEMEKALAHYRGIYGDKANESYTFLRAWNGLKKRGNYISLPRQSNYFCGARLHHWNFVVGTVEIGSGSHEEKREAFRLATTSALDFLLSAGRGVRRPNRASEVKRERVQEASARNNHRSPSLDSTASNRVRAPPADEQASGNSAGPPTRDQASVVDPPSSTEPSAGEQAPSTEPQPSSGATSTSEPQSSAEPSSSPVTVERKETPAVTITPNTDSNNSHEAEASAEQSDPGEEMSISDGSDASALTPAGSPRGSTSADLPSTAPATLAVSSTPAVASSPPTPAVSTEYPTGVSVPPTASVGKPPTPLQAKPITPAVPPRRCMMCEMIRMRKPDGERCLRCQQKGVPANALGP